MPKERAWGAPDAEGFHTGAVDGHGHYEKARDIRYQPWLMDVVRTLAGEIPAYKGSINNCIRDLTSIGAKSRMELLDPEKHAEMMKVFQLHLDMERQGWEIQRLREMESYVNRTEGTLRTYAEMGSWMLVSAQIERLKARIEDNVLWEPHLATAKKLLKDYSEKLRRAKPK